MEGGEREGGKREGGREKGGGGREGKREISNGDVINPLAA